MSVRFAADSDGAYKVGRGVDRFIRRDWGILFGNIIRGCFYGESAPCEVADEKGDLR